MLSKIQGHEVESEEESGSEGDEGEDVIDLLNLDMVHDLMNTCFIFSSRKKNSSHPDQSNSWRQENGLQNTRCLGNKRPICICVCVLIELYIIEQSKEMIDKKKNKISH